MEDSGAGTCAADLPDLVLLRVLDFLSEDDAVSVGQVCRRWREVASRDEVWRGRELGAACDEAADGRLVARVVRFAPRLAALSVATTSWSGARAAVKRALLQDDCKIERLTDVWCHVDAGWAAALLAVHAETVREVWACHVDAAVLETLHVMASHRVLRGLQLWHCDPALRVQTLTFRDEQDSAPGCGRDTAAAEQDHQGRGLLWLDIFDLPLDTTLSLLRAHRRTLREVTLHVGTTSLSAREGDVTPLHLQLSACGLQAIKSLHLDRYGRKHPLQACAEQLAQLRAAFPGAVVACRQCEDRAEADRKHKEKGLSLREGRAEGRDA